jgi:hypothetical protein
MVTDQEIVLIDQNNKNIRHGTLSYCEIDEKCKIKLKIGQEEFDVIDSDYFAALSGVREKIYPLVPLINGARIDCFPSAMSRQMSKGKIAYRLVLGKQANEGDQLYIFDAIQKNEKTGSVKEQKSFYKLWISSLGVECNMINNKVYICIEKRPKYIYDPHKRLNEDYDFFWIYDQKKNKVYDIMSIEDIKTFKANLLKPKWYSFKDFFNWYNENYA